MTKTQFEKEFRAIRRDPKERQEPTMMQKISQACSRINQGNPTADDYRLIMTYPAMAAMFMRSKSHEI